MGMNDRASELARLCRSCALCCDGSLFGRVDLEPHEVDSARRRRLHIVANGRAFEQPCAALGAAPSEGERICTVYAERPRACARFVCRLHERHRAQGGPIEARLAVVARARDLVATLEALGLTAADLDRARESKMQDPRIARALEAYLELGGLLEESFARA
jgi:hypothetical protein